MDEHWVLFKIGRNGASSIVAQGNFRECMAAILGVGTFEVERVPKIGDDIRVPLPKGD